MMDKPVDRGTTSEAGQGSATPPLNEVQAALLERIKRVRAALADAEELNKYEDGEYGIKEALPSLVRFVDKWGEIFECGSVRFDDTPKALYRALFLFTPKGVDFDRMYKGSLLHFLSPCGELAATFEFYKFEAALYFGAKRHHIEGRGSNVLCGIPGMDNGVRAATEYAREWFRLMADLLNHEWMVYGGNDFTV